MKFTLSRLETLKFVIDLLINDCIDFKTFFDLELYQIEIINGFDLNLFLSILYQSEVDEDSELGEDIHQMIVELEKFLE